MGVQISHSPPNKKGIITMTKHSVIYYRNAIKIIKSEDILNAIASTRGYYPAAGRLKITVNTLKRIIKEKNLEPDISHFRQARGRKLNPFYKTKND